MKLNVTILILVTSAFKAFAQDVPVIEKPVWESNAEMNLYFFKDDFIAVPVFKADKNKLHLEGRYNYEDLQTFSAWVGYNFSGGSKFEYVVTPMLGGVVGLTNGVAPGLEMAFSFGRFEVTTNSELLIDSNLPDNQFFYNWSDFSYSPKDWLWVGISGQRTRLYKTDLDLQRGFLIGGALKNWELTTYVYNVGFDNPFVLVTVGTKF